MDDPIDDRIDKMDSMLVNYFRTRGLKGEPPHVLVFNKNGTDAIDYIDPYVDHVTLPAKDWANMFYAEKYEFIERAIYGQ